MCDSKRSSQDRTCRSALGSPGPLKYSYLVSHFSHHSNGSPPSTSICSAVISSCVARNSSNKGRCPSMAHMAHARVQISEEKESPRCNSKRTSGGTAERGVCDSCRHSIYGKYASPKSARRTRTSEGENVSEALPSQIGGVALGGTFAVRALPSRRKTGCEYGSPNLL